MPLPDAGLPTSTKSSAPRARPPWPSSRTKAVTGSAMARMTRAATAESSRYEPGMASRTPAMKPTTARPPSAANSTMAPSNAGVERPQAGEQRRGGQADDHQRQEEQVEGGAARVLGDERPHVLDRRRRAGGLGGTLQELGDRGARGRCDQQARLRASDEGAVDVPLVDGLAGRGLRRIDLGVERSRMHRLQRGRDPRRAHDADVDPVWLRLVARQHEGGDEHRLQHEQGDDDLRRACRCACGATAARARPCACPWCPSFLGAGRFPARTRFPRAVRGRIGEFAVGA